MASASPARRASAPAPPPTPITKKPVAGSGSAVLDLLGSSRLPEILFVVGCGIIGCGLVLLGRPLMAACLVPVAFVCLVAMSDPMPACVRRVAVALGLASRKPKHLKVYTNIRSAAVKPRAAGDKSPVSGDDEAASNNDGSASASPDQPNPTREPIVGRPPSWHENVRRQRKKTSKKQGAAANDRSDAPANKQRGARKPVSAVPVPSTPKPNEPGASALAAAAAAAAAILANPVVDSDEEEADQHDTLADSDVDANPVVPTPDFTPTPSHGNPTPTAFPSVSSMSQLPVPEVPEPVPLKAEARAAPMKEPRLSEAHRTGSLQSITEAPVEDVIAAAVASVAPVVADAPTATHASPVVPAAEGEPAMRTPPRHPRRDPYTSPFASSPSLLSSGTRSAGSLSSAAFDAPRDPATSWFARRGNPGDNESQANPTPPGSDLNTSTGSAGSARSSRSRRGPPGFAGGAPSPLQQLAMSPRTLRSTRSTGDMTPTRKSASRASTNHRSLSRRSSSNTMYSKVTPFSSSPQLAQQPRTQSWRQSNHSWDATLNASDVGDVDYVDSSDDEADAERMLAAHRNASSNSFSSTSSSHRTPPRGERGPEEMGTVRWAWQKFGFITPMTRTKCVYFKQTTFDGIPLNRGDVVSFSTVQQSGKRRLTAVDLRIVQRATYAEPSNGGTSGDVSGEGHSRPERRRRGSLDGSSKRSSRRRHDRSRDSHSATPPRTASCGTIPLGRSHSGFASRSSAPAGVGIASSSGFSSSSSFSFGSSNSLSHPSGMGSADSHEQWARGPARRGFSAGRGSSRR